MKPFEMKDYKVFDMFNNQWALVTAGTPDHYNTCTIAWGSLGTIWGGPNRGRSIVTVYVNPDRYTYGFLKEIDYNGSKKKVPTADGNRIGISSEFRTYDGVESEIVLLNRMAQRYIIDHLQEIAAGN